MTRSEFFKEIVLIVIVFLVSLWFCFYTMMFPPFVMIGGLILTIVSIYFVLYRGLRATWLRCKDMSNNPEIVFIAIMIIHIVFSPLSLFILILTPSKEL